MDGGEERSKVKGPRRSTIRAGESQRCRGHPGPWADHAWGGGAAWPRSPVRRGLRIILGELTLATWRSSVSR